VPEAGGQVLLTFENAGEQGAVFHVYDRLALDQMPRRYTVEAGKQLQGRWTTTGAYDLWVLGPNGFHRHIAGDVRRPVGSALPELVLHSARASGELLIELVNAGGAPCTFVLQANKYLAATPREITVVARSRTSLRIPLAASQNWYDLSLRVKGLGGWLRRFAGHLEDGKPSISDPALQGAARLDQATTV